VLWRGRRQLPAPRPHFVVQLGLTRRGRTGCFPMGLLPRRPPGSGSNFVVGIVVGATCAFLMLAVPLVASSSGVSTPKPRWRQTATMLALAPPVKRIPQQRRRLRLRVVTQPPHKPLGRGRLDPILSAKVVSSYGADGRVIYAEEEKEVAGAASGAAPSISSTAAEPAAGAPLDTASSASSVKEVQSASEASVVGASLEASPEATGAEESAEAEPASEDLNGEASFTRASSIEETSGP